VEFGRKQNTRGVRGRPDLIIARVRVKAKMVGGGGLTDKTSTQRHEKEQSRMHKFSLLFTLKGEAGCIVWIIQSRVATKTPASSQNPFVGGVSGTMG